VDYEKLSGNRVSESFESIRARVQAARVIQNKRFTNGKATDIVCNADMRIGQIRKFCHLQDEGGALSVSKCQSLMRAAMGQLNLSARAYRRILKLARTIAGLAGSEDIQSAHLAEAPPSASSPALIEKPFRLRTILLMADLQSAAGLQI